MFDLVKTVDAWATYKAGKGQIYLIGALLFALSWPLSACTLWLALEASGLSAKEYPVGALAWVLSGVLEVWAAGEEDLHYIDRQTRAMCLGAILLSWVGAAWMYSL